MVLCWSLLQFYFSLFFICRFYGMTGSGHAGQVFILHKNICPPPLFHAQKYLTPPFSTSLPVINDRSLLKDGAIVHTKPRSATCSSRFAYKPYWNHYGKSDFSNKLSLAQYDFSFFLRRFQTAPALCGRNMWDDIKEDWHVIPWCISG
jgi:hypothetical protein